MVCVCVSRHKRRFRSRIAQFSSCIPSMWRHCCCFIDPSSAFYICFFVYDYILHTCCSLSFTSGFFVFETLIKCIAVVVAFSCRDVVLETVVLVLRAKVLRVGLEYYSRPTVFFVAVYLLCVIFNTKTMIITKLTSIDYYSFSW